MLKLDSHNSEYQTPFEIEIDPNVSIGINIQKLYEKAKKAKRSIGKQTEQIKKLEKKLDDLNSHHHRLEVENVDDEVLYSLVEKLKLSTQKQLVNQRLIKILNRIKFIKAQIMLKFS